MPTIPFTRHTIAALLAGLLLTGPAAAIDFSVVFGDAGTGDQCSDCISISDKAVTLDSGSYVTKGKLFVGLNGTGSLLQSGGSLRIPGKLYVGANDSSDGLYSLQGGSFTSESTSHIGYVGKGQLLMSGGTFSTAELDVGSLAGDGSVFQAGGQLDVTGQATLRGSKYAQVGGVLRTGGGLDLEGIDARYLLTGAGVVYAQAGVTVLSGQFTMSGGTLNADMRVVYGTFLYGGGNLRGRLLPQTTGATLRIQADLALQGALDNTGWLLLEGATLRSNSTLTNTGRIQANGGFAGSGALHNNNSFTLTGDFHLAASGAHRNEAGATWDLAAGKTLWLDGAGTTLLNLGTLRLEAGSIAGTGRLDNRGSVTGAGQVLAQLDNSGLVELGAGPSVLGKVQNSGTIRLTDALSDLEFSSLDNTGTLGGRGTVRSLTTNRGTLVADGGTLRLTRRLSNEAGGLVRIAGTTALLQLAEAPAPNLGHLQLLDGQLALERGELEQHGTLSGRGTVTAKGLTNRGLIHLQAGSVLRVDNLRNEAGAELRASGSTYHVAVDGAAQLKSGSLVTLDGPQSRLRFLGRVQLRGGSSWAGNGGAEFLGGLDLDGASAMLLHTDGTLALGAANRLQLSIGGIARGRQHDALDAAGLAAGGVLEISLAGGWMPRAGDRYDLFDGAWSGGFSSLDFSRAALGPGMFWDAGDLASQGVLSVVSLGDAQDGGGLVRPPVPEPATWLLWACGLGLAAWLRRRRR